MKDTETVVYSSWDQSVFAGNGSGNGTSSTTEYNSLYDVIVEELRKQEELLDLSELSDPSEAECFEYVHFELATPLLGDDVRTRLEGLGVACLEEGGLGEAYGVIVKSRRLMRRLQVDPAVVSVEFGSPPCSK